MPDRIRKPLLDRRYPVRTAGTAGNLWADSPDLSGCVTNGSTRDETAERMREAMAVHLIGMLEDGDPWPEPSVPADLALEFPPAKGIELVWLEPLAWSPVSLAASLAVTESGLSKGEVARRMGTTPSVVSRLTNPFYFGHSLDSLERLATALGRRVEVRFLEPRRDLASAAD